MFAGDSSASDHPQPDIYSYITTKFPSLPHATYSILLPFASQERLSLCVCELLLPTVEVCYNQE